MLMSETTLDGASVEHHGVQPTGCMDNEPEPSRGLPVLGLSRKTDQFRLDPTQNCAPGWWCDRESSVYHLALEMYSGIFRHASRMHTKHQLHPCPVQPTMAMTTTHIHQLLLTRPPSTRSSSASEDHPQALVVIQRQQHWMDTLDYYTIQNVNELNLHEIHIIVDNVRT